MLKQLLVATALTCGAATAFAQSPSGSPPPRNPAATTPMTSPLGPRNTAAASATVSTGDFNASGQMAGRALIGAKIHNDKDTVGSIDDVYLDDSGNVKVIVVSVGGFLGVGGKNVAVKWDDLKFGKDGKALVVTTTLTRDALKALPDYKFERQKPAPAVGSGG